MKRWLSTHVQRQAAAAAASSARAEPVRAVPRNKADVQLLSQHLSAQIFGTEIPAPNPEAVRLSHRHLEMHGLSAAKRQVAEQPQIEFDLPPLQGDNIKEHFYNLGEQQSKPYWELADAMANTPSAAKPKHWNIASGWTRYSADGSFDQVAYPDEVALVFDVETMYKIAPYAVMATAVSSRYWYSWISPWLLSESTSTEHLIPLGPSLKPRLAIGHNVGYDRARLLEEYTLEKHKMRFLDTMSLHAASNGLSSPQRGAWLAHRKNKMKALAEAGAGTEEEAAANQKMFNTTGLGKTWLDVSAMNSLAEVARLHCGIQMDKTQRNAFGECSKEEIVDQIDELLAYCANDVAVTQSVFSAVWPRYLESCPSPASLAGILEMSTAFLPIDEQWPQFIERAETIYNTMKDSVTKTLHELAEETRGLMYLRKENGEPAWAGDPWLSQLDWSFKTARRAIPLHKSLESTYLGAKPAKKATVQKPVASPRAPLDSRSRQTLALVAPFLLKATWRGFPVCYLEEHGFCFDASDEKARQKFRIKSSAHQPRVANTWIYQITPTKMGAKAKGPVRDLLLADPGGVLADGLLDFECRDDWRKPNFVGEIKNRLDRYLSASKDDISKDGWLSQIADLPVDPEELRLLVAQQENTREEVTSEDHVAVEDEDDEAISVDVNADPIRVWPKWFWDLDRRPAAVEEKGVGIDLTIRTKIAPLLLKLTWYNKPLFHSRTHGWLFRIENNVAPEDCGIDPTAASTKLVFDHPSDLHLAEDQEHQYFKLPHHDGGNANVGSPLSKGFIGAFEDGRLCSLHPAAAEALEVNAKCSYWLSARERIINQMTVWPAAMNQTDDGPRHGLILPQVVTMGTVTRRAVENTWLTASNAKANRVGSELKSLVRAPPGYAIVGADVDSEELWICSVMGDSAFGFHGATAIGWMTLEGTKSLGTDMHSATAKILGISRDGAKVFNYSRIYGAGVKHAVDLLRKANSSLSLEKATDLAKNLYANTKGTKYHTLTGNPFRRKFWYGGTESYVFNTLEGIAMHPDPRTPALGCGITSALRKDMLPQDERSKAGEGYLPSRINWVVQSSGVDYLHLLIVAMTFLCERYDISARYMISVHDEIRYLVREKDKYRTALALQIANLWTRSVFAFSLGMHDLPQSCAFFSAVDIDHVLRKEVTMPCVTPSNPDPIAPGIALDILQILDETQGSLRKDGSSMANERKIPVVGSHESVVTNLQFLEAQAVKTREELLPLLKNKISR